MATTRSVRSSALGSIRTSATRCSSLEGQAGRAGCLGERLDPPVVLIAAAIEDDLLDAARLRPLGQQLAHHLGRGHVAARLRLGAEVGRAAVHRGQGAPARVVDHLRVDVAQAAEHRQPRPLRGPDDPSADAQVADLASPDLLAGQHYLAPAFLPTFRRMYSSAYLMPLPLYGSGLRRARSLAATCPSNALSAPLSVIETCRSISACTPSGNGKITGCEYPSASWRFLPVSCARSPMPTISSFRSNPSLTPCTMFASSDRVSPWSARTLRWSELRSTVRTLDSILTETLSGTRCESCPLGPSTRTVLPSTAIFTPSGTGIGFLPIRDMFVVSSHTKAGTAPPSCCRRVSRSVMTPREVERMATPIPPRMCGTLSLATYTRRPGFDTRTRPEMIFSPPVPYLRYTRSVPCLLSSMKRKFLTKPSSLRTSVIRI